MGEPDRVDQLLSLGLEQTHPASELENLDRPRVGELEAAVRARRPDELTEAGRTQSSVGEHVRKSRPDRRFNWICHGATPHGRGDS